ncbi:MULTISPECIES: hypothetical protein [unclassified Pseudofrankia]|uniref:hypothetical protein n=1 Tax=unclassified Pseudofrankia TaxID=2994372 RepID=UPI0008D9AF22|nr:MULTISPECIES: hypothetical protein [unclassified Pseudofrankia]MDT3444800.1 hypothetical protein [Pseudofrankia sp. BMG5.37]OHV45230.1 hypothetical protein BCD48_23490 [Pseudofrankia sp. BMG5.36]
MAGTSVYASGAGSAGRRGGPAALPPAGLVANERRGTLLAATAALRMVDAETATAFDQVTTVFDGGAWEGRAATAWGTELSRVRAVTAEALAGAALDCAGAARAEPEWVAPDDPRAIPAVPVPGVPPGGR